ncbi:MAG: hypothetical protein KDJ87_19710, partial [Rhizobiaceae bacterium]|nr:hypothetical protein [Rhizobiaceae bacterium]
MLSAIRRAAAISAMDIPFALVVCGAMLVTASQGAGKRASQSRHHPFRCLAAKRDTILASDRPFRRQVIKLLAALCLGRRRAHYHAWLPSLRIEGREARATGRILYRGRRVGTLATAGILRARADRTIVIVGSGPSVKNAPLHALPPRRALLLNGAISLIGERIA